jgi:Ca-activated chloride channel homolog
MRIQRRLRKIAHLSLAVIIAAATLVHAAAVKNSTPLRSGTGTRPQNDRSKKPDGRQGDEPQDPNPERIKIDTQLVELDVTVVDQKNNNPILNLNKNDFTVYEDKAQQTINSVSYEEVPLSFGIVIDTSGSMRPKLQTISNAALDLFKQVRSEDECFLTQFKTETELVQGFTNDPRRLEKSLDQLFTSGGTALLDAIIATSDYAQANGKYRRKAIIVISDGLEKNSAVKEKEVIRAIKENDVQLYLIGFLDEDKSKSFFGTSPSKKAQQLLTRLADDSGGRAFFPKDLGEIPGIAAQIAKDLRTQYIISYYPSNEKRDGTYRTVQVDVKSKRKLIVRTRQGYYAPGEMGTPVRNQGKVSSQRGIRWVPPGSRSGCRMSSTG